MSLHRRQVLAGMGAALVAPALVRPARAAGRITVLNWQGYGTDEPWALANFKAATGIEVVSDYFSSEPEMLTKLRTNPGVYDVVLINSARTTQASGEGLLEPIDLARIRNAAALTPALRDNANLAEDGAVYGVSWVWGMNALGVREGQKPDSFAAMADPAYAGRVAMFDDATSAVGLGALMTGQDINDPADLGKVAAFLKSMKPNIKLLWSSEDQWNKSFAAKEFDISLYWSGAAVRSRRTYKLPVDFIVPKEGAIGWLDGLSVPADAPNAEAALQFINYMIDPAFYTEWATKVGAPASASDAAMQALPADDLNRLVHKPDYIRTLNIQSPLPDERREGFNNLWQEIKAFYAA